MSDEDKNLKQNSDELSENIEFDETAAKKSDNYVVGVGASAGGYEAIESFFRNMPPDTGMSFVVVQHLSPDFKSLMVELLSKHTDMEIFRVEDHMEIKPNCVYLIPPRKNMTIFKKKLYLNEVGYELGLNLPINIFFRSLAEDLMDKAIGIILSGTGSDGTLGIRDIKGAGGMVIAQDTVSSKFDGMPKSAISTGLVDYILTPEEMPEILVKFINHISITRKDKDIILSKNYKDSNVNKLLSIIKQKRSIDFSYYKPTTVVRRVEKRMAMNQMPSLVEYLKLLEKSNTEVEILANELLINVTKFFREKEVFEYLTLKVLPKIFQKDKRLVRVWVPGCSTGEEPYSLAIIFKEYMEANKIECDVKIFGTDIDKPSLSVASAGIYSENIIVDVSKERLSRFFTRKENTYQVSDTIRKMVIFANQNIIKDAPFNKIDMVTLRNLLIYFGPEAQKIALSYVHFALNPDGFLLLGKSETVGEMNENFKSLDNSLKIFKKVGTVKLNFHDRRGFSVESFKILPFVTPKVEKPAEIARIRFENIYKSLMSGFEPSAILVNEKNESEFIFGEASKYIKIARGKMALDVLSILREELAVAVGTALHKVRKDKSEVLYKDIFLKNGKEISKINLRLKPVFNDEEPLRLIFIIIEEVGQVQVVEEKNSEVYNPESHYNLRIKDLETELQITKENLQATVEELETSNEELQATNEELLASNEELQSTNEELQSVNEELMTVNAEYQTKLEELLSLSNDFDNLLKSSHIGTLFIDKKLNIRKFTPDLGNLINIMNSDIGRPITHFSHNFEYTNFVEDIQLTISKQVVKEKEILNHDGRWYSLRIRPFIASDGFVEGAVVTLLDIDDLKIARDEIEHSKQNLEEKVKRRTSELKEANTMLEKIIQTSPVGIYIYDFRTKKNIYTNENILFTLGYKKSEIKKMNNELIDVIIHPEDLSLVQNHHKNLVTTHFDEVLELKYRVKRKDGTWAWFLSRDIPYLKDDQDKTVQIIGTAIDISDQIEMELKTVKDGNLLKEIIKIAQIGRWDWDISAGSLWWSDQAYELFALEPGSVEPSYEFFLEHVYPEDRDYVARKVQEALEGKPYCVDHRILLADGTIKRVHEDGIVYYDKAGKPSRMTGTVQNISNWDSKTGI